MRKRDQLPHAPGAPVLVIATTNAGKFREFRELLGDLPISLRSLAELPGSPAVREDGATYESNARQKAQTIACWSGHAVLADDSGLEVEALGGAPGVHSARYAGVEQDSQANIRKLLHALGGVPSSQRGARFCCVIAVAGPDGAMLIAEGSCVGSILEAPRGAGGFGYDPVFLYPPLALTFAEMSAAQKNCVSHRAQACRELRRSLVDFLSAHAGRM
jgi:XTP/dITP diphosphohydrolase